MTWTKLDDGFWSHPKVLTAGNAAAGAYVRMLAYIGDHNLDGYVDDAAAKVIANAAQLRKLEECRLIERQGNGWLIPGYLEYNPSREQVKKERERSRERMAKLRRNGA